jgi:hypothetical protein
MLREKLLFEFNFHTELGVMQVDVVGGLDGRGGAAIWP